MASSSAAVAQPVPLHSSDNAALDIRHPTPDLQSLQGAYVGNIERLEEHAERMSEAGSDLGEEIRKLQLEQKLSDSRRSSMRSLSLSIPANTNPSMPPVEEAPRQFTTRSRNASTSSYTNSIVDVVGQARWGGYSPAGYVTSPAGSLRSGSFTQHPPSQLQLQRQRSGSKASRLGKILQTEEEEDESARGAQQQDHQPQSPKASQRSVSSFTQKYDQIANEIQSELRQSVILDSRPPDPDQQSHDQMSFEYNPYAEIPDDRPTTPTSTDTAHRLGNLWQDFDGAHAPETVPEEQEPEPALRESSFMATPPELEPQGVPPPDDGMVFYPAPVPRMLNLPQRLSKLPAANTQARRRTQLLESMQADNRKSGAWPAEGAEAPKNNRKSRQSLAGLPPQLRASAFFDQAPPTQEFEVKGESAEDTLNNILEAAAHAPVSAFTDHPFAGHVGDEVYGKEHKRKSKANVLDKVEAEKVDNRKSRSSLNLLDTRRNSNGELLNKLKKRNSSADLNMLTVRANESRMSLGDDLDSPDPNARGPGHLDEDAHRAYSFEDADDGALEDHEDGEEEEEEPEDEMAFGPPTTLLAELQMRKAQQKSRNLTAATAFPNGMHSTLLELDAVAEIENKKRKQKKVNLAWEAQPPQDDEEDSDDDVPLGVLFPGRDGLVNRKGGPTQQVSDWDRPLGLIAQREMEENEPLSHRRTRLFGDTPKRHTQFAGSQSQSHLAVPATATLQPESEEDEGETLAQRMRRMKDRQTLDDAIGDVRKSTVSGDFANEMMSQFGVGDEKPKPSAPPANAGGEEEEETLGQRRARLQAEALARGDANPRGSRPPLRASMSMADVLGAHPVNPHNQARNVTDEALMAALPQGSLLRQSAEKQEKHRASRRDVQRRISGFGALDQPLLGSGVGKEQEDLPIASKIQAYKDKLSGGMSTPMTAPPMFNQATPGMPSAMPGAMPGDRNSYFPQGNMGMIGMSNMNMSMPMLAPQMNPMGMQVPMNMNMNMNMGMGMGMGMGMQGMMYPQNAPATMHAPSMMMPPQMQFGGLGLQQQGQAMMMEPPMDPRQRAAIDRWRESVMN
ncbi:hypothetical protein DM02DRAFT_23014 [Periconia macrospinosa]|uniref:Uncharacterized protein n=1 Tax=Periconia macrospinosa TaxID=97972 RepID=A0A2V1DPB6_9PLEO|nr:hypothetical protein DM02DRAFT_23014 [Periconia macrospinosa]